MSNVLIGQRMQSVLHSVFSLDECNSLHGIVGRFEKRIISSMLCTLLNLQSFIVNFTINLFGLTELSAVQMSLVYKSVLIKIHGFDKMFVVRLKRDSVIDIVSDSKDFLAFHYFSVCFLAISKIVKSESYGITCLNGYIVAYLCCSCPKFLQILDVFDKKGTLYVTV